MRFGLFQRAAAIAVLTLLFVSHPFIHAQAPESAASPESALSIPKLQLLQPVELSRMLQLHGAEKPLVLQVGSHLLFAEAHIAGSEFAGSASQPAGLKQLQDRVAPLPRATFIVLYCGCCPWDHCPNIGPAFKLVHDLGFSNVKALYIAGNFGADWVDKGYPVERGR
jgi:thiosulfate/3-mercaptopyruvate sulfurtransferase